MCSFNKHYMCGSLFIWTILHLLVHVHTETVSELCEEVSVENSFLSNKQTILCMFKTTTSFLYNKYSSICWQVMRQKCCELMPSLLCMYIMWCMFQATICMWMERLAHLARLPRRSVPPCRPAAPPVRSSSTTTWMEMVRSLVSGFLHNQLMLESVIMTGIRFSS